MSTIDIHDDSQSSHRSHLRMAMAVLGGVAVAVLALGLFASPAEAASSSDDELSANYDNGLFTAPDEVDVRAWDEALVSAQEDYGAGDKAYLEALKETVGIAAIPYCNHRTSYWINSSEAHRLPEETGAFTSTFDCLLESGNGGPGNAGQSQAVQTLQEALNVCHGRSLAWDGDFGPATYTALLQVQSSLGITADGVYGPQTRRAMSWTGNSICRTGLQILGY